MTEILLLSVCLLSGLLGFTGYFFTQLKGKCKCKWKSVRMLIGTLVTSVVMGVVVFSIFASLPMTFYLTTIIAFIFTGVICEYNKQ